MKRCPKCNRSFPDDNQKFCTIDGGLLLSAEQAFDPNATIAISSLRPPQPPAAQPPPPQPPPVQPPPAQPPPPQSQSAPPPRDKAVEPLDPNATIAGPRVTLPKKTEATGAPAVFETLAERPITALPPRPQNAPVRGVPVAPPQKKSKLPLILGI